MRILAFTALIWSLLTVDSAEVNNVERDRSRDEDMRRVGAAFKDHIKAVSHRQLKHTGGKAREAEETIRAGSKRSISHDHAISSDPVSRPDLRQAHAEIAQAAKKAMTKNSNKLKRSAAERVWRDRVDEVPGMMRNDGAARPRAIEAKTIEGVKAAARQAHDELRKKSAAHILKRPEDEV